MSNHTGTAVACQSFQNGVTLQTTPSSVDNRLVARYGAAALGGGYAAIPHIVMKHRRSLGVSTAEWDYICEIWSYWRSTALPAPSVEALTRGLGVDQSTIRRYRASLEGKGLLRVVPAGPHNRYDLRPLIDAAVGLDHLQSNPDDPAANTHADTAPSATGQPGQPGPSGPSGPCSAPPSDRSESHAYKEIEKKLDFDSIPPYPPLHRNTCSRTDNQRGQSEDPNDQALTTLIDALGAELGDDAPASSLTRARNLCRDAGVSLERFLALLDEAATRTRARQEHIVKRRQRDDQTPNGMPYLFAVLQDLLHPAPARTRRADSGPDCWRGERSGRRRGRRASGHDEGEAANPYATCTDSPVRQPITEVHPIWRATLEALSQDMTVENFNRWLVATRLVAHEGDLLRIVVADHVHYHWLDQRLRGAIERAVARIAPELRVAFVIAEAA